MVDDQEGGLFRLGEENQALLQKRFQDILKAHFLVDGSHDAVECLQLLGLGTDLRGTLGDDLFQLPVLPGQLRMR